MSAGAAPSKGGPWIIKTLRRPQAGCGMEPPHEHAGLLEAGPAKVVDSLERATSGEAEDSVRPKTKKGRRFHTDWKEPKGPHPASSSDRAT